MGGDGDDGEVHGKDAAGMEEAGRRLEIALSLNLEVRNKALEDPDFEPLF